jgi:hypothetical protein
MQGKRASIHIYTRNGSRSMLHHIYGVHIYDMIIMWKTTGRVSLTLINPTAVHCVVAMASFTSPSQPKIFPLTHITSNLSTHVWSIKRR